MTNVLGVVLWGLLGALLLLPVIATNIPQHALTQAMIFMVGTMLLARD